MNQNFPKIFDVIIVGGGLAGLSSAIHLSKYNLNVLVIEKNNYPKHKVCGEYISNEVLPYLEYLGIEVFDLGAQKINKFELSTYRNKILKSDLTLGGLTGGALPNPFNSTASDGSLTFKFYADQGNTPLLVASE